MADSDFSLIYSCLKRHRPGAGRRAAFTLVESLTVMIAMALMMALAIPVVQPARAAEEMTRAAYDVAGVLENARAYAIAHHTYVWVGFYEEDAAKGNAVAGTGRVILSTVASRDGTTIYDPNQVESPATAINPGRLTQIQKLVKIENVHLKTAVSGGAVFPRGSGTGDTFPTRPAVSTATAQIGDSSPPNPSLTPFQYPVGSDTLPAKYLFSKVIQFSPRGEARVDNTNYSIKPVVEIGLQPSRGNTVDAANANVAAVQVSGLLGNVKIYRP
ncbi:MAG: hypothetical protein PHQ12_04115 [Chthoniobacteraceae bacterium]|nr:hypothetical protein [Chthoniobacteraceae bacterium]